MELLVFVAIIVVLLLVLGVNYFFIILLLLGAIELLLIGISLFFIISMIMLIFSKKVPAVFNGFEEKNNYKNACYLIENDNIKNLFPAEKVMQSKIYNPNAVCNVYLFSFKNIKCIFDKHSIKITICGLVLSILGLILLSLIIFPAVLSLFAE